MKNSLKLLLASILGGLVALLTYQGILTIMNQEIAHEVKVKENNYIIDVVENTSSTVVQIINTSQSDNIHSNNNLILTSIFSTFVSPNIAFGM